MIVFQNPGLIDLAGIRIVGVSVKLPDSIGRFGTGIKYGFGTILREGGKISLYRGDRLHKISTRARMIRDQEFHIVTIDGKETGFSTGMGRDWKPWMVLRELASNAMDEEGSYHQVDAFDPAILADDVTTIVVEWDDLDAAYRNRGELFLEGETILETDDVRLVDKRVRYIYNRGIRVHELPGGQSAAFAYDMKHTQLLTEDRTLLSPEAVKPAIAKAFLRCEDEIILRKVLFNNNGYENGLDFDQHDALWRKIEPTRAFIDMCIEAREAGKLQNESAKKLLMKFLREEEATRAVGGGINSHPVVDWLVDQASMLGFEIDEEKIKIVLVPELPGTATTLFEKGRIYILRAMMDPGQSRIGLLQQFLLRLIESELPYPTYEGGMKLVLPKLMAQRPSLREMIDAENKAKEESEEAGEMPEEDVAF